MHATNNSKNPGLIPLLKILAVSTIVFSFVGTRAVGQRPNIIVVIADDMAAYDVNALGNSRLSTPNLDMLAHGGMIFQNAFNMGGRSGAVCLTSRGMMMSGRYMWSNLGPTNQTLGTAFNNAGYETFITSKAGNTYSGADNQFTFQGLRADRRGPTGPRDYADSTISYMNQKQVGGVFNGDQTNTATPYLAQIALANPHDARDAPQEFLNRHGAISGANPSGWTQSQLANLPDLPQNYLAQHPFDNGHLNVRDETGVQGVGTSRAPLIVRNELGKQNAVIEYMDLQIGRILAQAEAVEDAQAVGGNDGNNNLDNTIVIFTSDHGIAVGSHGLMGKQNMYDHTVRVPMIAFGAGVAQGTNNADIYLGDLFPTLLDLSGTGGNGAGTAGAADDAIEFQSFGAAVRGQAFQGRDAIYSAYTANNANQRAVKVGDWKLIHYSNINRTQLFNLADNPRELLSQDLAHDVANYDKLMELNSSLLAEMDRYGDPGSLGAHVGINVAFGKTATQSSTFNNNSDFAATNATDGAGSTLTSTTHTASDDENPSWMVNLEESFEIDQIVMHNREDCCQGRLRDILVEILDENMSVVFTSELLNPDNVLGGNVFNFDLGPNLLELSIDPIFGQYVRISRLGSPTNALANFNYQQPSDRYVLALDEVQVFAVSTAAIPEPTSTFLFSLGFIAMASARHRRAA